MDLSSLIYQTAEQQLASIRDDGSVPAGHNGLYRDEETPVRNTSHWLHTYCSLYQDTGEHRFREVAERMISYLQSQASRPHGQTFYHREQQGKDRCNGLIGQAWTIEALAVAAHILDAPEVAEIAEDVFLIHPQDRLTGIWKRIDVDGRTLPFDATFNHQLWFAAAGGLLADTPWVSDAVDERVQRFLDEIETNLRVYQSGLIYHPLKPTGSPRRLVHLMRVDERSRIGITFLTSSVPLPSRRRQLEWKAIGYHAFNLYAFALLKRTYPDHNFWETSKWKRVRDYIQTDTYRNTIWKNEYGSPYNPVGFEVPFAMKVFAIGTLDERRYWVTEQLKRHYNTETKLMDRNTVDPETLTARIYQATQLDDMSLSEFDFQ